MLLNMNDSVFPQLSFRQKQFLDSHNWKSMPVESEYVLFVPECVIIYFESLYLNMKHEKDPSYKDYSHIFQATKLLQSDVKEWIIHLKKIIDTSIFFCLIRGWGISEWDGKKLRIFYLWICEQIGNLDYERGPFYEVFDRWWEYSIHQRYSDTRLSLGYHTDSTQKDNLPKYIGLLCIQQSEIWGESKLINMVNIYKRMIQENPIILSVLETWFFRDSKNHENSYPIFQWIDDRLIFRYMRRWIEVWYETLGTPLSIQKVSAIDYLDDILSQESLAMQFKIKEGDILLFDNTILAHDRTEFSDKDTSQRLLVRSWIY